MSMSLKRFNFFHTLTLFVAIFCMSLTTGLFALNLNTPWEHFSDQSQSYLKGRLDVTPLIFDQHDYTLVNGKYYWPQGPFPAVLLMPFQAIFGPNFEQGVMQGILFFTLIVLLYSLLIVKKIDSQSSIFLICAFIVGSPIVGIIIDPKSWFYAQIVAVVLLLALLLELETNRRWLILGVLEGALIATRPTSGFIFLALFILLITQKTNLKPKIKQGLLFFAPIILSAVSLLWFNYLRFGDPLDNGYQTNNVGSFISPLRDIGLFSTQHIPSNFYYYFLISVQPFKNGAHLIFPYIKYDVWGLSLLLVAPFFIYAFKSLKNLTTYTTLLWITVGITLITQLMYYAPGWYQFGPRYTADFLPILFVLLLYGLNSHKITLTQKIVICLSSLFNLYLLITPLVFQLPS